MAHFSSSHDVRFEDVLSRPPKLPLVPTIPKIGHIVHTKVSRATWKDYASARAFLENIGVEKLNVWVPEGEELPGEMWSRIANLSNVILRPFYVPKKVWGKELSHPAHWSDVSRIKILYGEGGIYLDTDVVALKSSDDIIFDPRTKATVMSRQMSVAPLINAVIMSKPGSPFLHRWMKEYKNFSESEWDHMTSWVPYDMFLAGEPDLTLLDDHAWMYPKRHGKADDIAHPHLSQMWTGKSWYDIDYSHGVHFWKWLTYAKDLVHLTPEMARTIDTPLFCRLRKLFDNIDGDGYSSTPWEKNPNCTISWVKDLNEKAFRLFADYRMNQDTMDMKWIDSSGHRNHGWAAQGTKIVRIDKENEVVRRRFDEGDHAWLSVPADWDARVGTARMSFQLHPDAFKEGHKEIGLFKIRVDWTGEVVLSLKAGEGGRPLLKFQWEAPSSEQAAYKELQSAEWTSATGLPLSSDSPSELAISFDRRKTGRISVYLNGEGISNGTLPLLASSSTAGEIWMNGRDWRTLDAGFRGDVYRFRVYADALQAQDLVESLSIADIGSANWNPYKLSSNHQSVQSLASFLLILLLVVASATVWRHGKKVSRYLRCMVLNRNRHVRFAPLAEDSESNLKD